MAKKSKNAAADTQGIRPYALCVPLTQGNLGLMLVESYYSREIRAAKSRGKGLLPWSKMVKLGNSILASNFCPHLCQSKPDAIEQLDACGVATLHGQR